MKKTIPAASPDAYVLARDGWRRELVEGLRAAVRAAAKLEEVTKWGHLIYFAQRNGWRSDSGGETPLMSDTIPSGN